MMQDKEFDTEEMLKGVDKFLETREVSKSDPLCPQAVTEAENILGQGFSVVNTLGKTEGALHEAGFQINLLPDPLPEFHFSSEVIKAASEMFDWKVLLNVKNFKLVIESPS